ncbi:MAG: glycosyltransferase, partial [Planctomycetota bacterium]
MRILAIYRHYWPDTTPYARILKELMEDCADRGHEVTVVTGQPSYNDIGHEQQPWKETRDGVRVVRFGLLPERKHLPILRMLNFSLFLLRAVCHAIFSRRYDVVIANSHPPLLMGWALRTVKFFTGTSYIYHCQDVHPESAKAIGKLQSSALYRLLRRSDAATCRLA